MDKAEPDLHCAEQRLIEKVIEHSENPEKPDVIEEMALVNYNFTRPDQLRMAPCDLCLDIMRAEKDAGVLEDSTLFGYLERKPNNPLPYLNVVTLGEVMPLFNQPRSSFSEKRINTLPVNYSDKARQLVEQLPGGQLKDAKVKQTLNQAKAAWEQSEYVNAASKSGRHTGAAILLSQGDRHHLSIYRGKRVEYRNLERLYAVESAAYKALEPPRKLWAQFQQKLKYALSKLTSGNNNSRSKPRSEKRGQLQLVAYYSKENERLPEVRSLGRVAKLFKQPDFLIATIENNTVRVRAFSDYLPIRYTKANHLSQAQKL